MNETKHHSVCQRSAPAKLSAWLRCLVLMVGVLIVPADSISAGIDLQANNGQETPASEGLLGHVRHFDSSREDRPKYVLFDDPSVSRGWLGGVVRWRYNDAGRNASVIGASTAAATIATIQAAQAKWSAVCNVKFIYVETTMSVPTPQNMLARDGVSAVGWTALPNGITGVAGIANAGSSYPLPIVEGDIHFNNANSFSYPLDVTALHETGHMLGIDHSDVASVVMSGPPLTSYVSLSTLQADDIAGCVRLYGVPGSINTATISGKVTNFSTNAPISGVVFCARPSSDVTCVAPLDGSGNYSCTVFIGWSGVLHSPNVSGNRIPPQYFSAVTANTTRDVPAVPGTPPCILDVDNNGLIEVDLDGVAILRRIAGFTAPAFAGLSGACAANATPTAVFNGTSPIANYNVTGGTTRLATDGAVLTRALLGLTGTAVTDGLGLPTEPGVTNSSWSSIQNWLASNCGVGF